MSKSDKDDIFELLLEGHSRGVRKARETAIRTRTRLIVQKNGKIMAIKPKYKYVRVPIETSQKKRSSISRRTAKSRTPKF